MQSDIWLLYLYHICNDCISNFGPLFLQSTPMCSSTGSAWFAEFTGTQLVDAGFWLLRLKINGALFSTHAAHMHKWHIGRKFRKTTIKQQTTLSIWSIRSFFATKMTFLNNLPLEILLDVFKNSWPIVDSERCQWVLKRPKQIVHNVPGNYLQLGENSYLYLKCQILGSALYFQINVQVAF